MSIRKLPNVSCGLNLGLIYNLSYSYTPKEGVRISIFFVNETGNYNNINLNPPTKTSIQIGPAFFSMYPISFGIEKGPGRRVMKVDFVDDTFRLDNYLLELTGRGCGEGVYQLGKPVDNRTLQQKTVHALDRNAEIIKNFTQFPDIEYTFGDFIAILKLQFPCDVNASYDLSFTKQFVGTFREVLNDWCNFYNLSYFFENGVLRIFDPTRLTITLPQQDANAIEYNYFESADSTYSKTAFAYFQKDGGQFNLNSSASNGVFTTADLYPVNSQISIKDLQTTLDMNQVVAAQYGKEFWFLYNYSKGTAGSECGWEEVAVPASSSASALSLKTSLNALVGPNNGPAKVAKLDTKIFTQKYEAYYNYGQKIAGKFYISDLRYDISTDSLIQWFNITNVTIVDFASDFAKDYQVKVDYFLNNSALRDPNIGTASTIDSTVINDYYTGIKYVGDRMVFIDDKFNPSSLLPAIEINTQSSLTYIFNNLFNGLDSSRALDVSILGAQNYVIFFNTLFDQPILELFKSVSTYIGLFDYRYQTLNLAGLNKETLSTLRAQNKDGENIIIYPNIGGNVSSNTGLIRAINNGNQVVYYDKFSICANASSGGNSYFKRRFSPQNVPYDIPITFSYSKNSLNSYKINRDLSAVNAIINSSLLRTVAQSRAFTTKKVTMTFNYFIDLPVSFLTNGLVNMNIEIGDSGMTASYVFSNEVLQVPGLDSDGNISQAFIEKLEANIKNSWIRTYDPDQIISIQ